MEDLFQVGCIGLIKAYNNFDDNRNTKFTSYAYNYIVGEIYQYIINNQSIRTSPSNIKLAASINKAEEYLTNHLNRKPSVTELCSFLEIEPYKYEEMKNLMMVDNIDNLYDLSNSETFTKDEFIDLRNALTSLSEEEKKLISARYFNNYTQQELAKLYNTNQVKICREEKRILSKLKSRMLS